MQYAHDTGLLTNIKLIVLVNHLHQNNFREYKRKITADCIQTFNHIRLEYAIQ